MSQSAPPPAQPPVQQPAEQQPQPEPQSVDGVPSAPQPADGAPYAPQPGAVPPPPAPGVPYGAVPAPAPVRNNLGLGLVAAFVAALVAGGVYGAIIGLTKHEIGWAAVGVGFLVGLAAGRLGGRNPVLPVASAVLSLGSVYIGQLVGEGIIGAKETPLSFSELFFQHFDVLQEAWKADADPLTFLFFAIAAYVAFTGARKAAH
ncbi:hypothetical protein [Streptomyces griseorubiginosus]|uniref:hypothetical protein n=1 Tax=Streptomyces griseorubiginosus TaxID=67304 RepID=UPI002E8237C1|nr:hypothetical protein [Streptomyces griseorubiginosus]WUB44883.1 hypothetical protein OHN19_16655 [Streptomyces griseorubiginosus]WUB53400.1 hypothetical protein OG942_16650 [Streptomyces griseorubiginosus]